MDTVTSSSPAIHVRGLSKSYGRTTVLDGLDLEMPWGEVLVLLGPNGSGKTTLIKALATLTKPDAGQVRVAGFDPAHSGTGLRRLIGVVTHEPMLYADLTGHENLRFFARLFSLDRVEERIARVARTVGMAARLGQRAGTLSHGMQKRLSIARALLHEPRLLLLDEPESGLDQEALALLETVIKAHAAPGRAVLMATHNLERAMALGHRMAVLSRGKVAYQESLRTTEAATVRAAYLRHTEAMP
jgi:heme ABC exporter ATP-binding subunit CcmA